MSRVTKRSTALFSLVGLLILFPIIIARYVSTAQAAAPPPPPHVVRAALIRAGLGADALAAAGLSAQQVNSAVSNAESLLAAQPTRLREADLAYSAARNNRDALERKIQSGLASQQEVASFAGATSALASAEAERAAALGAIFEAATQSLAAGTTSRLVTIRANRERGLPLEFLTLNRTDAEWLALRNALSNERIAAKYEEPPNSGCQSLLGSARANPTVAASASACSSNRASVTAAWNSATAD